jgi:(p)ppGpp synthase/HD superfamily hydrolase
VTGPGAQAPEARARADAMAERVLRTAREAGVPAAHLPLIGRALALAMEPRLRHGVGAHHHDLLHPGRTALILLLDTAEQRAEVLAAAALAETERPDLQVDPATLRESLGSEDAFALLEALPDPGAEDLTETLLLAPPGVQLVALAERLDQLRHAHLWQSAERMRAAHRQAVDVYAPIAERVHPKLSRRYDWWCRMFERKHPR